MLRLIILGEGDLHLSLLTDLRTYKLLLKSRDESAGADCQGIVFSLAALKRLAVHKSFEIQRCHIAVLHGAVFHRDISCVVLTLSLNLHVDLLIGHRRLDLIHLYALVFAELYLRLKRNRCRKYKRLARLDLGHFDLRRGDDLLLALVQSLIVCVGNQYVRRLLEKDLFAVHPLYHLAGHLTLPEARYADFALLSLISFLDSLLKFLRTSLDRQLRHVLL